MKGAISRIPIHSKPYFWLRTT